MIRRSLSAKGSTSDGSATRRPPAMSETMHNRSRWSACTLFSFWPASAPVSASSICGIKSSDWTRATPGSMPRAVPGCELHRSAAARGQRVGALEGGAPSHGMVTGSHIPSGRARYDTHSARSLPHRALAHSGAVWPSRRTLDGGFSKRAFLAFSAARLVGLAPAIAAAFAPADPARVRELLQGHHQAMRACRPAPHSAARRTTSDNFINCASTADPRKSSCPVAVVTRHHRHPALPSGTAARQPHQHLRWTCGATQIAIRQRIASTLSTRPMH